MKKVLLALAPVGALAPAVPAQAALMDAVYNFEASFASGPNSKVDGTFTVSFDPKSSSVPTFKSFSSQVLAGYDAKQLASRRFLTLGNCSSNGCDVQSGQSQFYFYAAVNSAGEVLSSPSGFTYAVQGKSGIFNANSVTVSRVTSAVPEPTTWAMMLLGFGVVGYSMRARRNAIVRFA